MKLVFSFIFILLSLNSYASKARLIALGEDQDGSFYIQDNRNIFLNVAQLNNYKDFVTFEWGGNGATSTSTDGGDNDSNPKAEGGFTRASSGFVYGLNLGGENNRVAKQRARAQSYSGTATQFLSQDNVIDFLLAGDAGVQWGFGLTYSNTKDDMTDKQRAVGTSTTTAGGQFDANQTYVGVRVGAIIGNIDLFANIDLKNRANGTQNTSTSAINLEAEKGDVMDEKVGYKLGGSFMFNDLKTFATQTFYNWDVKDQDDKTVTQKEFKTEVGVGRVSLLNDKTKFYTKIQFNRTSQKNATTGSSQLSSNQSSNLDLINTNVPLTIGIEHEIIGWFILRGSIAQEIYSQVKGDGTSTNSNRKVKTTANSTSVNVGSTFTFGQLMIDGLIGTTGYETCSGGVCKNNGNKQGIISTDNILTRVALRYNF